MKKENWGGARQGAGRKPVEDKAKARSIMATDEEWDSIKRKAKGSGMSISRFIVELSKVIE